MASVITIAGEKLFAAKAQANEQLDIDTFIFANVPAQDPAAPINRDELLPADHVVHQQIVQQVGRINENVVVYSTVLDSVTGPFEFNWVGLYSSVNQTLVAINHIPSTAKTITEPGAAGNTLNRNFGIEYSGIADLTGINVAPETWQLDFTARLSGMDELTRNLVKDLNGKDSFIDDGFKVVPRSTSNTFSVLPGVGYVNGLRVELLEEQILIADSYPKFIYVDAYFEGDASSTWSTKHNLSITANEVTDYIDSNGKEHFVFKIANVIGSQNVIDLRENKSIKSKVEKLTAMFNFNVAANPKDYGVIYGGGLDLTQREDNAGNLQRCLDDADEVKVVDNIETYGQCIVHNKQKIFSTTRLKAAIIGTHPTEPTLSDATIERPNSQSNNLWGFELKNIGISSILSDAIKITPYQCVVSSCKISSPMGTGLLFHDGGYQVENEIEKNYFYSCKKGIYAPGGFRSATDQFIEDNYFYGNGKAEFCIEINNGSGNLYDGNHYYGGAEKEFLRLIGGANVRIVNEYYEGMDNSRIYLSHGNPSGFTLSNNTFWQGDGSKVDYRGDQSSLITTGFSEYNQCKSVLTANIFEGGINNVPIFNILNGSHENLSSTEIQFNKSNMLNGSYALAVKGASGNANNTWMIQSDHLAFRKFNNEQNADYFSMIASEIIAEASGSATTYPSLPGNNSWLRDKKMIINNTAGNMEMSFSALNGKTVTGLNPVPPLTKVEITARDSGYFIVKG